MRAKTVNCVDECLKLHSAVGLMTSSVGFSIHTRPAFGFPAVTFLLSRKISPRFATCMKV